MFFRRVGRWLTHWYYGSGAVTKPQGRFFLKIDKTGIEFTPFTTRFFYLKRDDR